jgi:hypothetical protein
VAGSGETAVQQGSPDEVVDDRRVGDKAHIATIHPGPAEPLPAALGEALHRLQESIGLPVWVIAQDHAHPDQRFAHLDADVFNALHRARAELPADRPVALVIDSPGGSAPVAYRVARLLQRRCGYVAVVPRAAMSAATLLVLGADRLFMGRDAVLGPLDAQVWDPESETYASVLNEVQALERLRAYSLESIDAAMLLLLTQTGKKIESLLPHVLKFVADTVRPLLEKIDVVHYNERARILKEAEEYAVRLLRRRFPPPSPHEGSDVARQVASRLVEKYPEHGFPIDIDEVRDHLGLSVEELSEEQNALLDELWYLLEGNTVIGRIEEVTVRGRPSGRNSIG